MSILNKIILGLILGISACTLYFEMRSPKIAYVRSADLIYKYEGMKEAQKMFELKSKQWQSNIDTLKMDYQRAIAKYNMEAMAMPEKKRQESTQLLKQQETNLANYANGLNSKAKQEDEKMTQGILNQVNSFVETYSQKMGYDLVLGTSNSGNILYGIKTMDITDAVLKELNEEFKSKPEALQN
jgi:outer membrane protein